MQYRKRILTLIQWSVSITLVSYLLVRIDYGHLEDSLRNLHVALLCIAIVQLTLQPALNALRWMVVARVLGDAFPFRMALRFTWIGAFFSQALPGTVGGDAVRMWLYWRRGLGRRLSVNTVALERAAMVVSLLILVALVQPGLIARGVHDLVLWMPYMLLAVALCGLVLLMLADRLIDRGNRSVALRAVAYMADDARSVFLKPLACVALLAVSIAAYANMATTAWLIGLALNLPITFADCLTFIPIVVLGSIVPISIGGWGVRESLMVVLFTHLGMTTASVLLLSVLFGVAAIAISLPGAALWIQDGYRRSDFDEAQDLASQQPPTL